MARIVTHGCRSNLAERDALARLAPAGSTVINSCAVTAQAVKDARHAVRAASGPVYVTGCAAATEPERFAVLGATVVPNRDKLLPQAWGQGGPDGAMALPAITRQSRAFVAVQDGCDHDCTFCITRIARGASRSVPLAEVVARVAALVAAGVNEVVLTGIDLSGHADGLGHVVQAVLARTSVRRLRLSSIDPAKADAALVEAFAAPQVMPHVHLSLQSGDDLVLKRMKRRHSAADARALVERLRRARPDLAVGADLIAGFPTETEAAHRASLAAVADLDIVHGHIFPYSPRPGTAAARMPPVLPAVARGRAAELRAAAASRLEALNAHMEGRLVETLSEGKSGMAPNGVKIAFQAAQPRGALVAVRPYRQDGGLRA